MRVTTRLRSDGSSSSALGVPARRNSAYASSTTTTPVVAAASHSASTTSSGSAVPVGLLGDGSSTTLGCSRSDQLARRSGSSAKSLSRCPSTHRVPVSRAYSGYIEYVGAKLTAVRPGPPKACSRCSITSLEPLAAQTWSGVTALAPVAVR